MSVGTAYLLLRQYVSPLQAENAVISDRKYLPEPHAGNLTLTSYIRALIFRCCSNTKLVHKPL
jgi:hypothetical protein